MCTVAQPWHIFPSVKTTPKAAPRDISSVLVLKHLFERCQSSHGLLSTKFLSLKAAGGTAFSAGINLNKQTGDVCLGLVEILFLFLNDSSSSLSGRASSDVRHSCEGILGISSGAWEMLSSPLGLGHGDHAGMPQQTKAWLLDRAWPTSCRPHQLHRWHGRTRATSNTGQEILGCLCYNAENRILNFVCLYSALHITGQNKQLPSWQWA